MKRVLPVLLLLVACGSEDDTSRKLQAAQLQGEVKNVIISLHESLVSLYNGQTSNVDSVIDRYYVSDMYYVAPWATSEPLDSTKSRLRNALPRVRDYSNDLQNLSVKVYGDGTYGYAFFILRQTYSIDGYLLEEYLPTTAILEKRDGSWKITHLHRSTDYQTMQQYAEMQRRAQH